MNKPAILVIIPVYNPPERFYGLIKEIKKYLEDILIINDGSDNLDKEYIAEHCRLIDHESNMGKGKCLIDGFLYGMENNYEWVISIDGDYQHQPEDIPKFLRLISQDEHDIINGNRTGNRLAFPWIKYYSNTISSRVLSFLIGERIKDAQCGFRAYRLSIFKKFFPGYHDFSLETEVLIYAVKLGFRIKEIDIQAVYFKKKENISHFRPVRDFTIITVKSLFVMIKLLIKKGSGQI